MQPASRSKWRLIFVACLALSPLGGMFAHALGARGREARVDPHLAAVGPAELTQRIDEGLEARLRLRIVLGQADEHADPPDRLALLPARIERQCRRAAEHADEFPSAHVISPSVCRRGRVAVGYDQFAA